MTPNKILFVLIIIAISLPLTAQEICYNNATPDNPESGTLGFLTDRATSCGTLHDISELQLLSMRLTNFGFGTSSGINATVADDFSINETVTLNDVKLYAYQNRLGGNNLDEIEESAAVRIWSGKPGESGSTVIYGDLTENVLKSSVFTGAYRTNEVRVLSCDRPIMEITADLGCVELQPGKYWLEWQIKMVSGTTDLLALKEVPLTSIGQTTTGDAVMSLDGENYMPILDSGPTKAPQGLPFIITEKISDSANSTTDSTITPIPTMGEWGLMSLCLLLLIIGTSAIKQQNTQLKKA